MGDLFSSVLAGTSRIQDGSPCAAGPGRAASAGFAGRAHCPYQRIGATLTGVHRHRVARVDPSVIIWRDHDDGESSPVKLLRHYRPQGEDRIGLQQHDGCRCGAQPDGLGQHGGARARPSTERHHEDPSGQPDSRLRVTPVRDSPRLGIEPTPEGEGLLEDDGLAASRPGNEYPRAQLPGSAHSSGSRHTFPSAAERRHSSVLPNTTSTPMLPGA